MPKPTNRPLDGWKSFKALAVKLEALYERAPNERAWIDSVLPVLTRFWQATHWRKASEQRAGRKADVKIRILGCLSTAPARVDLIQYVLCHMAETEDGAPSETLVKRYTRCWRLYSKPINQLSVSDWRHLFKYDKDYLHRAYSQEEMVRRFSIGKTATKSPRDIFATTVCRRIEQAVRAEGKNQIQAPGYYQVYNIPPRS